MDDLLLIQQRDLEHIEHTQTHNNENRTPYPHNPFVVETENAPEDRRRKPQSNEGKRKPDDEKNRVENYLLPQRGARKITRLVDRRAAYVDEE
jgi:hypothetical protein